MRLALFFTSLLAVIIVVVYFLLLLSSSKRGMKSLALEAVRRSNLIPVRVYRIDRSLNTYNNFTLK